VDHSECEYDIWVIGMRCKVEATDGDIIRDAKSGERQSNMLQTTSSN
jgi:hypothetical protein